MSGFPSSTIRYLEALNVRSCPWFLQHSNFVLSVVSPWPRTCGLRQYSEAYDDSHALRTVVSIHAAGTDYLVSVEYPSRSIGSRPIALGFERLSAHR